MNSCLLAVIAFVALVVFFGGLIVNPFLTMTVSLIVVAIVTVFLFGAGIIALVIFVIKGIVDYLKSRVG